MRTLRVALFLSLAAAGLHAGTFTVTTASATGPGSLYDALYGVINSTSPTNTIAFAIGSGPVTIHPPFQYPYVTKPVVIDGTTQPGYAGTPIVELDGGACNVTSCIGLRLMGGNSTIKGLVVNNYSDRIPNNLGTSAGISLASSGNTVVGCYIGTDITGQSVKKNDAGIRIENGANGSVIGTPASRNLISGNNMGIEATFNGPNNMTGGTVIQSNWFGYTASGAATITNYWGLYIQKLSGGRIGGTGAGEGNLFADLCAMMTSTGVAIQGNRWGTNATTTNAGLAIGYGSGNIIGGTAGGAGNTFTNAPGQWAITIQDSGNNVVQGNSFSNMVMAVGIYEINTVGETNGNMIGGTAPGAGNTIRGMAHSLHGAVTLVGNPTGTSILGNSISGSAGTGIDLGDNGHTANDPGDADGGANGQQNYPVLNTVTSGNGTTTVAGTLNSKANGSYRIELFSNPSCNASGYGEGETYLGFANVTTDSGGNAAFVITVNGTVAAGRVVTATATDSNGSTSEFSACAAVGGNGALLFASPSASVSEGGGSAAINVSRISGANGTVTVNYATLAGTATAGSDYTTTSGTLTFGDGETSKTINVPILQDTVFEGNETFSVVLSAPGGGALLASPSTIPVTILDDDIPSHLTISDAHVSEGNAGTTDALFTVTVSPAPTGTASIQWTTNPGTATAGSDFTPASGTLTFNAGETQKNIAVSVLGDTIYEPDETFSVTLSNPVNLLVDRAAATGTIANDDPQPVVSDDDVTVNEGNAGTTSVTIKLKVSQPLTASINYATVDDTARSGSDFVAATGSVEFNNETEKQFTIAVNGDTTPEPDERFRVHLSTTQPWIVLAHPDVVVTIANDDVSISPTILTLATGRSGNLTVDFGNPVTATQTLAIAKSDACIKTPASADVAAGQRSVTFAVDALTAPCSARVDVTLPPVLGGTKLSAGVRTFQSIDLTFSPAAPQLFVGQSISVVVKATPYLEPITLSLAQTSTTVDIPATVDVGSNGGTFTMKALKTGPITVSATLPAQYGGTTFSLIGNVVDAPPTPTILDVTPKSGATTGGTPVSIIGSGFIHDCSIAFDGSPAPNVAFVSAGLITASTPAHKPGAVDVTATCNGTVSTLKNGFVYTGGAPDITSIDPASGTTLGGTTVRIGGRDLTPDCWVELGGELARNVSVTSATEMIATTPAHAAGAVTVKLRCNGGGAAGALPNGFTYVTAAEPSALVTGIDPLSAAPGQKVTILGSRFRPTDDVTFETVTAQVLSTTPDAHVVVVPSLPPGKASVTVAGSTTGPIFTVLDPEAPKVTKTAPASVPQGAELTIDGSGFRSPYTFTIGGLPARIVTLSFTRAVVRVPVLAPGHYELDVVNAGNVVTAGGNITVSTSGIVVAAATPVCIATDGGTPVSISGSGFAAGATVTINGVAATNVKVVDGGRIDALTPALPSGFATIVVTNPSGDNGSATNALRATSPLDPDGCAVTPRPRPAHR
jgi:Calx-beta domain/IPT/TIG domain